MVTHLGPRTHHRDRRATSHRSPSRPQCRLRIEPLEERCLLTGGDMVLQWNATLLGAVRAAALGSPLTISRAAAIVQLAVYEAVNAIDQTYTRYLVDIPAPTGASKEAAAAQAAHDALVGLFPAQQTVLDLQLKASLQTIADGEAKTGGIRVGRAAAQILLAVRAHDGAARVVTYTPGTQPGNWQPTPPAFLAANAPHWASVIPFALPSASRFRPPAPPGLTSPEYTSAFNQVKGVGSFSSTTRTADQTEAALFWAGIFTPNASAPGEWNQVAQQVAVAQGNTLVQNARLFALLNMAEADALIAGYDAKYTYNYWRPVTAIPAAATDANANTDADPNWRPLFATPNHPAYPSTHSTVSAASAQALASFFSKDAIAFRLSHEGLPGVTRSFASFSAAAAEAGLSRIWGGIHWSFDNTAGQTLGQSIGQYVFQNFLLPRPSPPPGSPLLGAGGATLVQVLSGVPAGDRVLVGAYRAASGPFSSPSHVALDGSREPSAAALTPAQDTNGNAAPVEALVMEDHKDVFKGIHQQVDVRHVNVLFGLAEPIGEPMESADWMVGEV